MKNIFIIAFILIFPIFCYADSEEDLLDFNEDLTKEADQSYSFDFEKPERERFLKVNGRLETGLTFNFAHDKPNHGKTDWRGLSGLKSGLSIEAKLTPVNQWTGYISAKAFYDFAYSVNGRDQYTSQVLENYEKDAELKKAYIQGRLSENIDLKIGRQIVVWGKSDNIRVTDVLNPVDLQEPGLTDLEDLRLPITMTKIDFYMGDYNLTGIAIHEHRYNKMPEYGSEFYYKDSPYPYEQIPCHTPENTEFAIAINANLSQKDISLYFANIFSDMPYLKAIGNTKERHHSRLTMTGGAFNIAYGNWLLKTEAAWFNAIQISASNSGLGLTNPDHDYSRFDLMTGAQYSGFSDTTVSVEAANSYIPDFDKKAQLADMKENSFQSAFRISSDFWNQTLNLTSLFSIYSIDAKGGALYRFSIKYDVTDSVQASCGIVFYESGHTPLFKAAGDNDRINLKIEYSF